MFLKARDRVKKFYELIAQSNEFITNEKYEDAIGLYNDINSVYESIPKNMQTEALAKNLDKLNRELILYLKIKELHILIANKQFSKVPDILEYMGLIIASLKEQMPKPISLIKFGEEKIKYYENMHKKEYEKHLFGIKYDRIKEAIRKGDKKRALLLFEDLKLKIKDVEKYGKALELYEKIEQIREKIERPETIKHKAQEYYEHVYYPKKTVPAKKPEKKAEREEAPKKSVDEELSEIHKLLNKGDVNSAKRLFNEL